MIIGMIKAHPTVPDQHHPVAGVERRELSRTPMRLSVSQLSSWR
jgi:hypothetical protein